MSHRNLCANHSKHVAAQDGVCIRHHTKPAYGMRSVSGDALLSDSPCITRTTHAFPGPNHTARPIPPDVAAMTAVLPHCYGNHTPNYWSDCLRHVEHQEHEASVPLLGAALRLCTHLWCVNCCRNASCGPVTQVTCWHASLRF